MINFHFNKKWKPKEDGHTVSTLVSAFLGDHCDSKTQTATKEDYNLVAYTYVHPRVCKQPTQEIPL